MPDNFPYEIAHTLLAQGTCIISNNLSSFKEDLITLYCHILYKLSLLVLMMTNPHEAAMNSLSLKNSTRLLMWRNSVKKEREEYMVTLDDENFTGAVAIPRIT